MKDVIKNRAANLTGNRSLAIGLFITVLVMVLIVFSIFILNRSRQHKDPLDETRRTIQQLTTYPKKYQQAGLPQYPEGDVTYLGTEAEDEQPLVIYVNSADALAKVADYYIHQLMGMGWQENKGRSSDIKDVVNKVFTKDQQEYRLTITRDNENAHTNVIISWQP